MDMPLVMALQGSAFKAMHNGTMASGSLSCSVMLLCGSMDNLGDCLVGHELAYLF